DVIVAQVVSNRRLVGVTHHWPGEKLTPRPVGAQLERQDAARLVIGLQEEGARPISKQDAGVSVAPIDNVRESVGADHQRILDGAGLKHRTRDAERIDKTTAAGTQVERRSSLRAELVLN